MCQTPGRPGVAEVLGHSRNPRLDQTEMCNVMLIAAIRDIEAFTLIHLAPAHAHRVFVIVEIRNQVVL